MHGKVKGLPESLTVRCARGLEAPSTHHQIRHIPKREENAN